MHPKNSVYKLYNLLMYLSVTAEEGHIIIIFDEKMYWYFIV